MRNLFKLLLSGNNYKMRLFVSAVEKTIENYTLLLPPSLSWLRSTAPGFAVNGDNITVLQKPDEFYNKLVELCQNSKKRITLASLYLGTGHHEEKLVNILSNRLNEIGESLELNILLDANRGSRGTHNSRTMLTPLLKTHSNCKVAMFHTPALRGILRHLLPTRYNELIGLQHMKLYVFDNTVIVSGANLSADYFTNRQDRYIIIKSQELADFYHGYIQKVASVSLVLNEENKLISQSSSNHPFLTPKRAYLTVAQQRIWGYLQSELGKQKVEGLTNDTLIFPLFELPPFGIHQDSIATKRIIESANQKSTVYLATGYFNLTQTLKNSILFGSQAQFRILMAHPMANSFFKAPGLAGGIPSVYTHIALSFLSLAKKFEQAHRITLFEYQNPGWTFHAKGLWQNIEKNKMLTLVGSSNYGARSVKRDLESQIVIVTTNEKLKASLSDEQKQLFEVGIPFSNEVVLQPHRNPPLWTKAFSWLFKGFF
ncbi:CDP-diacylglycerol--glycerol-3-phosphate 3-phosphatidyltransferase, mitochondrial [Nilaparvata lugens]|uniref:CDP-diacylglycerol--glycerol-3-phosphate 3-phosphatidyltransferase, mitochondrial n=1 Tax=Nilaparvata lugens TaxID=108931 RepID=UPI00193E411A|nr:CDP-diacylglycerol--glycerol-3-phosphate 3-phosphatidyltransferase, mitochondrial [Nilaparvata lugens]